MAQLTAHQRFHVEAIIREMLEEEGLPVGDAQRKLTPEQVAAVKAQAQAIRDSGDWPPEVTRPCLIHNYLEPKTNRPPPTKGGG